MSEFWFRCLDELKRDTPLEVFNNWFADLQAEVVPEADSITVIAPSAAKGRKVRESYAAAIESVINRVAGRSFDINWAVEETAPSLPDIRPAESDSKMPDVSKTGLLPNLTFENLIEGQANQLAYASALQISSGNDNIYNPLFIYGGVGLGKTHLMHAIGNRYLQNNPKAKVRCVSAQQYTQEFIEAVRYKGINKDRYTEALQKFDARYKELDLLLLDDIQSFRGKDGMQTNFFFAFENMVPHGKQIVLTSDTYPRNLKEFQERLLSRLTQGLIVMIEPPEYEMRVQILLAKAEQSNLKMPYEVAEIIAEKIKSNVRELEGAVQQILAYTRFHQVPVTLESAKLALRDLFKANSAPSTVEDIQRSVADYYGITVADIVSKSRKSNLAHARQVAMYLAKELTNKSLPEIGSIFGGRDHTTVIYACRKIASERNTDETLKHDIRLLEQYIKN